MLCPSDLTLGHVWLCVRLVIAITLLVFGRVEFLLNACAVRMSSGTHGFPLQSMWLAAGVHDPSVSVCVCRHACSSTFLTFI